MSSTWPTYYPTVESYANYATSRSLSVATDLTLLEHESVDVNGRALSSPGSVVEVIEAAAQALVEDAGSTEGQSAVATSRETGGVNRTSLGWRIELELVVGRNVSRASLGILQDTVVERDRQLSRCGASNHDRGGRGRASSRSRG